MELGESSEKDNMFDLEWENEKSEKVRNQGMAMKKKMQLMVMKKKMQLIIMKKKM